MKRFSVFLVLALTVLIVAALTSCGCQASTPSDQTPSGSTPNNNTNTPGSGSVIDPGTGSTTPAPDNHTGNDSGNSSIMDDFTDDSVTDDFNDPAGSAPGSSAGSNTDNNELDLPTYDDMLRNGRVRDHDGFLKDDYR